VLYDPGDPADAQLRGEGRVLVPGITVGFAASAVLVAFVLFRTRNYEMEHSLSPGRRPLAM
jgi:hypothetical protein